MTRAGNGARGVVLINQNNGVSHVVNVVNKGGSILFVDSQIGRIVTLQPGLTLKLGRP